MGEGLHADQRQAGLSRLLPAGPHEPWQPRPPWLDGAAAAAWRAAENAEEEGLVAEGSGAQPAVLEIGAMPGAVGEEEDEQVVVPEQEEAWEVRRLLAGAVAASFGSGGTASGEAGALGAEAAPSFVQKATAAVRMAAGSGRPAPVLLRMVLVIVGALAIAAVSAATFHVLGARPAASGPLWSSLPGSRRGAGGECEKLLHGAGGAVVGGPSPRRMPPARLPSSQSSSSSRSAATPAAQPRAIQHEESHDLCPSMVVPSGTDFIFAVREVLARERQQMSFSIVDAEGRPLRPRPLFVSVRELEPPCGISLQMDESSPLAWVHTEPLHLRRGGPPEIRRPDGQVFCTIVREEANEAGCSRPRYVLRGASGLRLCTISGDFREKAVNVADPLGRLVSATERRMIDGLPYYQVRVGPRVDAGLVLCGLLAVDKMEGSVGAGTVPRAGGA